MIPRGVILDCCCVLMGANAGTLLRNKIPARLQEPLMVIFGMCAIAIGMVSVIKLESLPAVLLALILGTIIGELIDLDRRIKSMDYIICILKLREIRKFICGFIWWWQ